MSLFDIKELVPQRSPILMVDELLQATDDEAITRFVVRSGNVFLSADGRLEETALVEHIAQSASAFAGYKARMEGATEPPVGYIGEIKKFLCSYRPQVGDILMTTIEMGAEVNGVTLLSGVTRVDDAEVARTQMKIFVPGK
jgi:predicted hotdog family 3-hydroxylacyl-ACP dehydratase